MSMPPVVYVGPSLEPEVVKAWLPQAQVMPPIRRGELYRDRLLGFRVFLILDGVFFQSLAVSPREVIDVIRDGGIVAGASSMGAMRAAECWPAGMRGVGTIYRLFRRGSLTSDDEVAISLLPVPPYPAVSVPLINVRYACARAVREHTLKAGDAECIVQSATALHFSERTWPTILHSAGLAAPGDRLAASLQAYDLKRTDAIRALKRVRQWIADSPDLLSEGDETPGTSFLAAGRREPPHEPAGEREVPREALWRWLVASGRYRRYAATAMSLFLQRKEGLSGLQPPPPGDTEVEAVATPRHERSISHLVVGGADLALALRVRRAATDLAVELTSGDTEIARAVWADIEISGDADAIVFRFTALREAVEWVRARGLEADRAHRALARQGIAHAHGFRTWQELRAALGHHAVLWSWIEHLAEDAALAKCARQAHFCTPVRQESH